MTRRRLGRLLLIVRSLPTTLRFNLAYFPLSQALKLPVIVSHNVLMDRLGGAVELPGQTWTGMVRIGFGHALLFDYQRSRSIWRVDGRVVFQGRASLGHGTRLSVGRDGTVVFGPDFDTIESSILCRKAVSFGRGVLISWDVLVMDSDRHPITDSSGTRLNPDLDVAVGDHVWIGCRSTVLKGARIADGSVVGAGSVVTGEFASANSIIAGVPAREMRTGVNWS